MNSEIPNNGGKFPKDKKATKKKKKITKPKSCISIDEAKELEKQWCCDRAEHLQKCLGHEDAREFWWPLEELEQYIKYVKRKSKKMGIENPGIRAYFGAYPKDKCSHGVGKSTLFFAPTGVPAGSAGKDGAIDQRENNYGIDPFNNGSAGDPPRRYS
ncbi:hypothetical protein ACFSTE_21550 [Aquimarina hainanensis]|uniref:Uncharacterized protein n=1 Tax=Aquimarina hainanensis TaxID=1578017 RepID=A0ABW5ND09_9FLAO